MHQTWISDIELGRATRVPLETWIGLGAALGRPLAVSFSRPIDPVLRDPVDAGHLEIQEALLELAARTARQAVAELPTRPANPWHSVDVALRDDTHRVLILEEAWNTFGDVGAAIRSTHRKRAEAEEHAVLLGRDGAPYRVATVVGGQGDRRQPRPHRPLPAPVRDDVRWLVAILDECPHRRGSAAGPIGPRLVRPGEPTRDRVASPLGLTSARSMRHDSAMTDDFDFGRFDALTFDCYGTLIDWETGLSSALRAFLDPRGLTPEHDALLETYARFEAEAERPPVSHLSRGPRVRRSRRRGDLRRRTERDRDRGLRRLGRRTGRPSRIRPPRSPCSRPASGWAC